jgi:hypothetical protein
LVLSSSWCPWWWSACWSRKERGYSAPSEATVDGMSSSLWRSSPFHVTPSSLKRPWLSSHISCRRMEWPWPTKGNYLDHSSCVSRRWKCLEVGECQIILKWLLVDALTSTHYCRRRLEHTVLSSKQQKKNNSVAFSPQSNYTCRAVPTFQRS